MRRGRREEGRDRREGWEGGKGTRDGGEALECWLSECWLSEYCLSSYCSFCKSRCRPFPILPSPPSHPSEFPSRLTPTTPTCIKRLNLFTYALCTRSFRNLTSPIPRGRYTVFSSRALKPEEELSDRVQ